MIRTLRVELKRVVLTPLVTAGVLRVNGKHLCFILEDAYRPADEAKVPGRTCIPCGEYDVDISHSPRFGVRMPLVFNTESRGVVGEGKAFEGIRIHPGNTSNDTEGCLLPGLNLVSDSLLGMKVTDSRRAYDLLFATIEKAQHDGLLVKLTVTIVT